MSSFSGRFLEVSEVQAPHVAEACRILADLMITAQEADEPQQRMLVDRITWNRDLVNAFVGLTMALANLTDWEPTGMREFATHIEDLLRQHQAEHRTDGGGS